VLEKDQSLEVGDQLHGYTVEKIVPVSELSLTAVHLQHHSGAKHLHVARQDTNNVFGFVVITRFQCISLFSFVLLYNALNYFSVL